MVSSAEGAVTAFFDGLCEPTHRGGPRNPGGVCCGGWVILPHPDLPQLEGREHVGHAVFCAGGAEATNNRAEFEAAICALRALWRLGYRGRVLLQGDSQLVVRQYAGEYACRSELLHPLLATLRKAGGHFAELRVGWVQRHHNAAADRQSRLAYAVWLTEHAQERAG